MTATDRQAFDPSQDLRARAIARLKKRHEFMAHVVVYVLVNTFLVVIWWMTNSGGFFWPIFPMAGWGIGVIMNGWDVYRSDDLTEERIQREMQRLDPSGR